MIGKWHLKEEPAPRTVILISDGQANEGITRPDQLSALARQAMIIEKHYQRPMDIEWALDGIDGTTCVHICFGYAALIHERPEGYSFLPELSKTCCSQVSIETGQSGLDCKVLESLPVAR